MTGESSPNPNVRFISFPLTADADPAEFQRELDALAREHDGKIALLITEPYLGAKGSYHPPKWYHPMLQAWCEQHDIAFIFDEVQSCHGRTGNMYASQTYGVTPDLIVLGKGLANGVAGAAVVGRADLIDTLDFGEGSDTYSANPDACAAVCAVLDVFEEEGIVEKCRVAAVQVTRGLHELIERFPFVTAVRGEGLVYGLEIRDRDTANSCVLEAYQGADGVGVHFLGPLAQRVIRVSPPLVISDVEIAEAFNILKEAWKRI